MPNRGLSSRCALVDPETWQSQEAMPRPLRYRHCRTHSIVAATSKPGGGKRFLLYEYTRREMVSKGQATQQRFQHHSAQIDSAPCKDCRLNDFFSMYQGIPLAVQRFCMEQIAQSAVEEDDGGAGH
jgi:hypothetical protein